MADKIGTAYIEITGDLKKLQASIDSVHNKINQMAKTTSKDLNGGLSGAEKSSGGLMNVWAKIGATIFAATAGIKIFSGFILKSVESIDKFNAYLIQMGAMITNISANMNNKPLGEIYQEAKTYARQLNDTLEMIDKQVLLNIEDLRLMTQEMAKQGLLLDTNNQQQIATMTQLANAVATVSIGAPSKELQIRQELGALLRGEVNMRSVLATMLNAQTGRLKEDIQGASTMAEKWAVLDKYLKGFAAAQGDINSLWESAKTSLETIWLKILRDGMGTTYKDMLSAVNKIADWAEKHKGQIQELLQTGWIVILDVVREILKLVKGLEIHGGSFTESLKVAADTLVLALASIRAIVQGFMNDSFFGKITRLIPIIGLLKGANDIGNDEEVQKRSQSIMDRLGNPAGNALIKLQKEIIKTSGELEGGGVPSVNTINTDKIEEITKKIQKMGKEVENVGNTELKLANEKFKRALEESHFDLTKLSIEYQDLSDQIKQGFEIDDYSYKIDAAKFGFVEYSKAIESTFSSQKIQQEALITQLQEVGAQQDEIIKQFSFVADTDKRLLEARLDGYKNYYDVLKKYQKSYYDSAVKSITDIASLEKKIQQNRLTGADVLNKAWEKANPAKDDKEKWDREYSDAATRLERIVSLPLDQQVEAYKTIRGDLVNLIRDVEWTEAASGGLKDRGAEIVKGDKGQDLAKRTISADEMYYKIAPMIEQITEEVDRILKDQMQSSIDNANTAVEGYNKVTAEMDIVYERMTQIEVKIGDVNALLGETKSFDIDTSGAEEKLNALQNRLTSIMNQINGGTGGDMTPLLEGSYATGTSYVPKTGIYMLHEGEAVVPKEYNTLPAGQIGSYSNLATGASGGSRDVMYGPGGPFMSNLPVWDMYGTGWGPLGPMIPRRIGGGSMSGYGDAGSSGGWIDGAPPGVVIQNMNIQAGVDVNSVAVGIYDALQKEGYRRKFL